MFTGLVADVGRIQSIERDGETRVLCVQTRFQTQDLKLGESIAVDGICLTVTEIGAEHFFVEASPETLSRTTLGERVEGDRVHLERALRMGDRLGGHLVQGHVDGVGELLSRERDENAWLLEFDAPPEVAPFLIEKGSIALDGVSLTVNSVSKRETSAGSARARFGVAIIPHTIDKTNLGNYQPGRRVNLEADMIGKYVQQFTAPHS